MRTKKTIKKNIEQTPVKWIVTHPHGHVYSMPNLDSLLNRFGKTQAELVKSGWLFTPVFENSEISQ